MRSVRSRSGDRGSPPDVVLAAEPPIRRPARTSCEDDAIALTLEDLPEEPLAAFVVSVDLPAVSKNVIPASRAASTTARVAARSICLPKLLHPRPMREAFRR